MKEFGETEAKRMIERLSEHMATKKTNYRDDGHYALICKWIREDKEKPKPQPEQKKQINGTGRQYTDEEYLEMELRALGIK